MPDKRVPAAALIPVGLAPIVVGLVTRDRIGGAFGLSGDFWSGALIGVGIGLLLLAIVAGARSRRAG